MNERQYTKREHLWSALRQGDKLAYEALYKDHFHGLYEYGSRFCEDEHLVKDAIQDLFIKLWKNRANLAPVHSIKYYLFTALRNGIFNKLSYLKRFTSSPEEYKFDMVFSYENVLIELEKNEALSKKVNQALNRLTSRQKEVIYLRFYEGLSYPETAQLMRISVKAVYKIVARALENLKQQFGETGVKILLFLMAPKSAADKKSYNLF